MDSLYEMDEFFFIPTNFIAKIYILIYYITFIELTLLAKNQIIRK